MNCWICGESANSGDHFIKASDLRDLYGRNISTDKPIYLHNQNGKNLKLQSAKSDHLKSKAKLCAECNNNRVAPYDDAWMILLRHVNKQNLYNEGIIKVRFNKIFGDSDIKHGIALQLYFAKLFGCRIIQDDIPIDIKSFSEHILNQTPIPGLYLRFLKWGPSEILKEVHLTEIHSVTLDNTIHTFWLWMYSIGNFAVEVSYIPTQQNLLMGKDGNYHPNFKRNRYIYINDVNRPKSKDNSRVSL